MAWVMLDREGVDDYEQTFVGTRDVGKYLGCPQEPEGGKSHRFL